MLNKAVLLYYITDRKQFAGDEADQCRRLLEKIEEAARTGVDYIQLREKDLTAKELEMLAARARHVVHEANSENRNARGKTKLLINSRTDVALAVGADGVHLTTLDISASDARSVVSHAGRDAQKFAVAVSCHSLQELRLAESHGADFAVLAPIFGKVAAGAPGIGTAHLREFTIGALPDSRVEAGDARSRMPVFALGGVTTGNAAECRQAGAAGVAGIRLFQDYEVAAVVRALRKL